MAERRVEVAIDADLCVGSTLCTQLAPAAFFVDENFETRVRPDGLADVDALRVAEAQCPTAAITVTVHP